MAEREFETLQDLSDQIVRCTACPRLAGYRMKIAREKKKQYFGWNYWGKPLPGFGDPKAGLLIVGLAPAAHGGNRTGRMFTGDGSGSFLIGALYRAGFANQPRSESVDDGLRLKGAYVTAVVRCAPPDNKPSIQEMTNCSHYLQAEFTLLKKVRVVLALGKIAFDGYLKVMKKRPLSKKPVFKHGAQYVFPSPLPLLVASYHPSRQNTQTGRLTDRMFDMVLRRVKRYLNAKS